MARGDANQAILQSFQARDSHSVGVMEILNELYPAFAKKIFEGNAILETLVMTGYNMMDILDYPICGKCESLALIDEPIIKEGRTIPRCTCVKPGCCVSTIRPVRFRDWIAYELKKKAPPAIMEVIDYAIDDVAEKMLRVIAHNIRVAQAKERAEQQAEMGITVQEIVDQQGNEFSYTERVDQAPEDEPETVYINELGGNSNV